MSTNAITSSLLSQIADSPLEANEFTTDLNQLSKDIQSGDLSDAQQDWVTLTQDAQNGTSASSATTADSGVTTSILSNIAGSTTSENAFVNDLNQLGDDLENGDISSAQTDLTTLQSTAQDAPSTSTTSTSTAASQTEISGLIRAIVEALGSGYSSIAGSVMGALAAVAPSSKGAAVLQEESASLNASSSSTTNSLLQSLDSNNSDNSSSDLSFLA